MKDFDHQNVMKLIGISFERNSPIIITPFMANGDLLSYIRSDDNVLTVRDLLGFAQQIVQGIKYLIINYYRCYNLLEF